MRVYQFPPPGGYSAYEQRLAQIYQRGRSGEKAADRGGRRLHDGGFAWREFVEADRREKQYRATLTPEAARKREASFAALAGKSKGGGGFIGDMVAAVTSLPGTVASATTGKKGLLGSKGTLGLVVQGKFKRAAIATGHAVSKVTSNHLLQSSFGNIAVPAAVLSGAVKGGPKGALAAVKNAADNPITKAELAALAVVIPPLAPASAAGIAAMEATSRIVDGITSKDPKKIAQAAMQIGATAMKAKEGDPDAQRALNIINSTMKARGIVTSGDSNAVSNVKAAAKQGNATAAALLAQIKHQHVREAAKVVNNPKAKPALKAKGRATIARAQVKAPATLAGTLAALNSPKGVRVGDFAILRTARVLHKGKPIRKPGAPLKKPPLKAAGRR